MSVYLPSPGRARLIVDAKRNVCFGEYLWKSELTFVEQVAVSRHVLEDKCRRPTLTWKKSTVSLSKAIFELEPVQRHNKSTVRKQGRDFVPELLAKSLIPVMVSYSELGEGKKHCTRVAWRFRSF